MRKLLPVLAVVLLGLATLFLAVDPLGLLDDPSRAPEGPVGEQETLRADPTLAGRARRGASGEITEIDGEPVGVLDLRLGSGSLRGLVTGEGRPLPYARVQPVLPPPADLQGVRTRTDGTYEIRGLPAGRFDLRAFAEGWRPRTALAPPLAEGESGTVEAIDLQRVPALDDGLEVKVTDLFGRPLAGARVLATTMPWGLHLAMGPEMAGVREVVSRTALTDERGAAQMAGLPPSRFDVVVMREGYVTQGQPSVMVSTGRVVNLLFRLAEGRSIRGVVVDPEGKPLAQAIVTGLHQPSFASTETVFTKEDGTFSLDGLREGNYMLIGAHLDFGEQVVNPVKSPSGDARIQLSGTGRVDVQAVTPKGEPVVAYRLRPYREQPFGYVYSMVQDVQDPEGRASLRLSPGSWHLAVMTDEGAHRAEDVVKVEVGQETSVRIEMPAPGIVRGVVTDEAGNHVAGAEVYVRRGGFPPMPSREQYARSDAEGRFVVKGLPVGQGVGLHVSHPRYAPTQLEAKAASPAEAQEQTVRLGAGARVEGAVLDTQDRPVVGEQVNLFAGFNFFEARTTVTDAAGGFSFEAVGPGKYTVTTGPLENMSRGLSRSGVAVGTSGTTRVDFRAEAAGTKAVSGVVLRNGQPLAGATVAALDARGYEFMVTTTTDGSGRFRVEGMLPGRVTVRAEAPDGAAKTLAVAVPAEGEAEPATIVFGNSGVSARAVGTDGQPLSGAWVTVERVGEADAAWSQVVAQKTTAQDGTVRAGGLEAGTYQVRIQFAGRAPLLTPPASVGEGEQRDLGTFTLSEGFTLSGRVTDESGRPVEDATVSLKDSGGRPVFLFSFATSGSDGRYRVQELERGAYSVTFEASGYAPLTRPVTLTDAAATLDVVLTQGGEVRVHVEDEQGRPVFGARVTLTDGRGQPVTKTLSLVSLVEGNLGLTNEQGWAVVPDLAAGAYRVTARREGMALAGPEPQALVPGGGAVQVHLTMRAAP